MAKGVGSSDPPMALSLWVSDVTTVLSPPTTLPSPSSANPKSGIARPIISRPMPLIVSDTATALSPPKIAYKAPVTPITTTVRGRAHSSLIANNSGIANSFITASEPEYKTLGIVTKPYPSIKRITVILRTSSSNRWFRNSGRVVNAPAKYRGRKMKAIKTVATAAVTSQAILLRLNPYAEPFNPINCSAERLVSSNDPAIIGAPKPLPARK